MSKSKTYALINEKIKTGRAVVLTAEEVKVMAEEKGVKKVAEEVDVVTTATFGPMCSSGAFFNFGHADPPIKMGRAWLNDVPVYTGIAAVDVYLGAAETSERNGLNYGGAHVMEDLLAGRKVKLQAVGNRTDCYPRKEVECLIDLDSLNEAILFNPRNAYQNYAAATNSSSRLIYTYMGVLLPACGNVTYATTGELSPLLNDPEYRTVGVGTRIFLGGAQGYVAWHGTQHNPARSRGDNKVPVGPAATLSLIGNLKDMSREFLRAGIFHNYGVTLYVGVGVPIPMLDEDMAYRVAVRDKDIYTLLLDYGVPRRDRPAEKVSYQELKSGEVEIKGRRVPTAPTSSIHKARQIACLLKEWINKGSFFLQEPAESFSLDKTVKPLTLTEKEEMK